MSNQPTPDIDQSARNWPEGRDYTGTCHTCGHQFLGPKWRIQGKTCRACVEARPPTPEPASASAQSDELKARLKAAWDYAWSKYPDTSVEDGQARTALITGYMAGSAPIATKPGETPITDALECNFGEMPGAVRQMESKVADLKARLETAEKERDAAKASEERAMEFCIGLSLTDPEQYPLKLKKACDLIAELKQWKATTEAVLADGHAVHLNMLRGTIATPTKAQLLHVLGDQSLSTAEADRDRLTADCAALRGVLESVQWCGEKVANDRPWQAACPICGLTKKDGHATHCTLGNALADESPGLGLIADNAAYRAALQFVYNKLKASNPEPESLVDHAMVEAGEILEAGESPGAPLLAAVEVVRKAGNALREYLEGKLPMPEDIPDAIWKPFVEALALLAKWKGGQRE